MPRLPVAPFLLLLLVSSVAGLFVWPGFFYPAGAALVLIVVGVAQEWWAVLTGHASMFGARPHRRP